MHFYSASLRDAAIALGTVTAPDALKERLARLEQQEPERAAALAAAGGPETLVHGDLWPTNAIVRTDGEAVGVHFVDWDEAAVGPAGFDLSTLLLRFDVSHRPWMLDAYRRAVGRLAGWDLPSDRDLNVVFETVAQARLLSLLVWSIAAAAESDPGWLPERLESIVEWLDEVEPVLP
jgi:aminoglycoside phosphotransferase (APT) family kinase protein